MCRRRVKCQASPGNILPAEIHHKGYTTLSTAGPGGNPFFDVSWLAVAEVNQQGFGAEASQHACHTARD